MSAGHDDDVPELHLPIRLHGDTMRVAVDQEGLNPAQCRKGGGYVGFMRSEYIVVQATDGWKLAGRGPGLWLHGSGYCGKRAR